MGASDTPHDSPMLFFDNLMKKLDILSTSNIDIYPSSLEIYINNLLKLFFFGCLALLFFIIHFTLCLFPPPLKNIFLPKITQTPFPWAQR